ncbi:DNA repair protein RadC [Bacillus sp. NP157]|nr:DNA repair protein RadC [Bacillus sp. NP157]
MTNPSNKKRNVRDASSDHEAWAYPISAWPEQERPRERLVRKGPTALTDAELVAVLLGNGTPGLDAVATGRKLLTQAGGIRRLMADAIEMPPLPGFGPVKRARLVAALELASRSLGEGVLARQHIGNPEDCGDFLRSHFSHLKEEVMAVLYLNASHSVICFEVLTKGTVDYASVYPRELAKACIAHRATAVILVHNHPSGNPRPSQADVEITGTIRLALSALEVKVLDHVVVGGNRVVSMGALGMI